MMVQETGTDASTVQVSHHFSIACGTQRPRKPDDDLISYVSTLQTSLGISANLGNYKRKRTGNGKEGNEIKDESKILLVKNFFAEVQLQEASLASNKKTSSILEHFLNVLPTTSSESAWPIDKKYEALSLFLQNIIEYFGWLAYNRFSSHVFETYFHAVELILLQTPSSAPTESQTKLIDIVCALSNEILEKEEWWNMVSDTCATHVLRSLIKLFNSAQTKATKPQFTKELQKYLVAFSRLEKDDIHKVVSDVNSCLVFQIVMESTSDYLKSLEKKNARNNSKTWESMARKLLGSSTDDHTNEKPLDAFKVLVTGKVSSHLCEVLVKCSSPEMFTNLFWGQCFKGNLIELAHNRTANFVVQTVINRLESLEQVKEASTELKPFLQGNSNSMSFGIFKSLFSKLGLLRDVEKNEVIRKNVDDASLSLYYTLLKATGNHDANIADVILFQGDLESYNPKDKLGSSLKSDENVTVRVNIPGCHLMQQVLMYAADTDIGKKIFDSLLKLSQESLKTLCCDPVGGKFVIESWLDKAIEEHTTHLKLNSATSARLTRLLVKLIKSKGDDKEGSNIPLLVYVATNKFGWHILRKLFEASSISDKAKICKVLAKEEKKISTNSFGMNLINMTKLTLFAKSQEQWKKKWVSPNEKSLVNANRSK